MNRRKLFLPLALAALLWIGAPGVPSSFAAEPRPPMRRVGFVAPQGRSLPAFDAFRQGLADLGYIEGENIVIETRFAEGW